MSLLEGLGRPSEAMLLRRARNGDGAAFGSLYEQHLDAARRLARTLVADRSDADDVVAEVFAASFAAMRRGRGPVDDFRSYVLTSVRRECQRTWRNGARQRPGGDSVVDLAAARGAPRDDFAWFDEGDVVHRAFASLPPRLQHVLWLTEIEGLEHAAVAVRLGTSATNVAQLARRARLEFGARYLDEHLPAPEGPIPAACDGPRRVLAEVVRGTASRRAERLAAEHMATCRSCAHAEDELQVVNGRLRTGHLFVLLPALTISRPARAGLLARLVAWIAGPVPTMSAVASLVVATAVVPPREPVPVPSAAPVPPSEVVVTTTEPTRRPADVPAAPDEHPAPTAVDAGTFDPTIGAVTTAAPTDRATPTATLPDDIAPAGVAGPTAAASAADGPVVTGPTVPLASPPPLPDVPDAIEGVVDGVSIEDPLVAAITPVVAALPDTAVHVGLPPTPPVGPVGPTPPVSGDVTIGDDGIHVDAGVGPADVGVSLGDGGVAVDLPAVPDVVAALPTPVPAVVEEVPLVGSLLTDG